MTLAYTVVVALLVFNLELLALALAAPRIVRWAMKKAMQPKLVAKVTVKPGDDLSQVGRLMDEDRARRAAL